jgi:para-nitrobenzyl esterase
MLQTEKGKGKAYVYYHDHRTPQQPNGAGHGSEIAYVFKNLGGPVFGGASPATPRRPQDIKMADLMSSFWTNFAKTAIPTARNCPRGLRSRRRIRA